MMSRNLYALTVVLLLSAGCGSGRDSASVSGTVTNNGEPVEGVIVRFQPVASEDAEVLESGMGSFGQTDESGEYTLRFSDNERGGALIGEHVVIIDELTPEDEEDDDAGGLREKRESRIPKKYSDGSQRFTVKSGGNSDVNFDFSR